MYHLTLVIANLTDFADFCSSADCGREIHEFQEVAALRLTIHSDYALRVLTYVAVAPSQVATVNEVAASFRISHHHLVKVTHRLVKAGILEATRGRGWGLRLKLDPNNIPIGDIIRASEDDFAVVECLGQTRYRLIAGVCKFRELFRRALAAFFVVLDELILADAVRNPGG